MAGEFEKDSNLEVSLARLQEGMINLHTKLDLYHSMNVEGITKLNETTQAIQEEHDDFVTDVATVHKDHSKAINDLKRDRIWMAGIFSAAWAAVLAWVGYRS